MSQISPAMPSARILYIDKHRYNAYIGFIMTLGSSNPPPRCCPPPDRPGQEGLARFSGFFKALGDPTRLEILELLARADGSLCACDIETCFDLSQPTISHHLKLLREAGLVVAVRRGTWMHYALARDGFAPLHEALALVRAPNPARKST
jgi:ArsR family transcriptional regulator